MHELAIMQNVVAIAESEAKQRGFTRVLCIELRLGEYSGIVPACMEEFFPIASRDTVAEGARLDMKLVPATIHCFDCGYEGAIKGAQCPACGGEAYRLLTGREFFVESMEVE